MGIEQNKEIVRRFVAAVNARDRKALEQVVTTDVVRHSPATPDVKVTNVDDLWAFLERDARAVPDSFVTLATVVAEGDLVAVWATYTGTQTGSMGPFPPSGKRARAEFSGILRIRDGKIADMRVVWDNVDLLTQLGHMPAMAPNPHGG